MDVRIESSKILIYPKGVKNHRNQIAKESAIFFKTLGEYRTVLERVVNQIKYAADAVEYKKQVVVGLRNAIEIENEGRNLIVSQMHFNLDEKSDILKRLELEYNALEDILLAQELDIKKMSEV